MDTLSWIIIGAAGFSMLVTGATAYVAFQSHQKSTRSTNTLLEGQQQTIDQSNELMKSLQQSLEKANMTISMSEGIMHKQQQSLEKANQIFAMQRESIEENAYRNFKSGMVYHSEIEEIVREWFDRVKAAGINPPRYSKMTFIQLYDRTSAYRDPNTAPTNVFFNHGTRVVISAYRNRISIWRGLTHVLLGKGIEPIPDPKNYYSGEIPPGPNEVMYNGFLFENYDTASETQKDNYWAGMLDLYRVDLQQGP